MAEDLNRMQAQISALEDRTAALEVWRATTEAVRVERDKHMDDRFDRLEGGLGEVKGYMARLAWLIVSGIIGAIIAFIVAGGLASVPAL